MGDGKEKWAMSPFLFADDTGLRGRQQLEVGGGFWKSL